MPDKLTPEQRHKCMASIRSRNTKHYAKPYNLVDNDKMV